MGKIDIDELKREWSQLTAKAEVEPIVTSEMLRKALHSKAGKMKRYGWFNLIVSLIFGGVLVWQTWISENIHDLLIPFMVLVIAGVAVCIYQIRVYVRADDGNLSLVERESMLLRYADFSRSAMRWSFAYLVLVFSLKFFVDLISSASLEWWSFVMLFVLTDLIFIGGFVLAMWLERWERRRIDALKSAMRELEEFIHDTHA